jgi:hypothetical protein
MHVLNFFVFLKRLSWYPIFVVGGSKNHFNIFNTFGKHNFDDLRFFFVFNEYLQFSQQPTIFQIIMNSLYFYNYFL